MTRLAILPLALLLAGGACGGKASPPDGKAKPRARTVASTGVRDPALADLLERHWVWALEQSPVWATSLGVHTFDDQLGDNSLAAVERGRAEHARFLDEARALAARGGLEGADVVHLALFVEQLEAAAAVDAACRFDEWSIGAGANPIGTWGSMASLHGIATREDGERYVARLRALPRWIDEDLAARRRGAAAGRFGTRAGIDTALKMIDAQLAAPETEWPLYAPAAAERPDWPAGARDRFAADVAAALAGQRPALQRWRDAVAAELLPHARDDGRPGLASLPGGAACYAAAIRDQTSLTRDPAELHALGLRELERINAEMQALGDKLFGTRDLAAILARLRSDPALYFDSPEAVEAKAASALAAARAAIPRWFGRLPVADCVVRRVPDYEAPYTTIAYYREPNPDGSKPGEYYINVSAPETRPRYEAEVLAFHESIPGHHLQIAIAQELPDLPAFRKYTGQNAYVEGWALYSEKLADEMGLFSGDLDRMGMLSFEAWRASRLVVDTGLHSLGWSREQAVEFMLAHTALAENNIRNEVDRYIGWPGQALGYKLGQLTILELRAEAEAALGARFSLPAFHDLVLGAGPVTLPVLRELVRAWLRAQEGSR